MHDYDDIESKVIAIFSAWFYGHDPVEHCCIVFILHGHLHARYNTCNLIGYSTVLSTFALYHGTGRTGHRSQLEIECDRCLLSNWPSLTDWSWSVYFFWCSTNCAPWTLSSWVQRCPEPNIEAAPQQKTRRLQVISDAQASKLTGRPVEQDASWRGDSEVPWFWSVKQSTISNESPFLWI
jgi:hypothetical protein